MSRTEWAVRGFERIIEEEMPKVKVANKFLADKATRSAMIRRNVIQSSVFEGIYHVTLADLQKPLEGPAKEPLDFRLGKG